MRRRGSRLRKTGPAYLANLIAYYRFNDSLVDEINANNGTGTNIAYAVGKSGNGASFDSVSSYISITDNNDFSFTDGTNDKPFSICMWVNYTDTNDAWLINRREFNTSNTEWQIYVYQGKLSIALSADGGGAAGKLTDLLFSPTVGTWYHLGFTYSGVGNPKIYINGVLQTTTDTNTGTYTKMVNTNAPVIIGKAGWAGGFYFGGIIDSLPVFNKELSASEITNVYDTGNAGNELI